MTVQWMIIWEDWMIEWFWPKGKLRILRECKRAIFTKVENKFWPIWWLNRWPSLVTIRKKEIGHVLKLYMRMHFRRAISSQFFLEWVLTGLFSSLFYLPGSTAIIIVRSAATAGPPRTTRSAATVGPPRIQRLPIKNNVQFARRVFVRSLTSFSGSVDDLSVVNWWLVSVRCRWIVQVTWVRSTIIDCISDLYIYMRETNPSVMRWK